jgi:tyrosine-protein phosphatase YwqE
VAVSADIHFHLLPGVDDGPADMDETLELARMASAEGTATVVATPHVRSDYVTDARTPCVGPRRLLARGMRPQKALAA